MSLYQDTASILSVQNTQGSLKSRIYNNNQTRSKPAQIYALICEVTKANAFLKEVIEKSDILRYEPKLTPLLALLLVHDFLFSKSGISTTTLHPLRQAVERHKSRLKGEANKIRVRRKCATLQELKSDVSIDRGQHARPRPRWARLNRLKLVSSASPETHSPDLRELPKLEHQRDEHIPNLLAFKPEADIQQSSLYLNGQLILQDKASCFPAYLLLGDQTASDIGDVVDGCAAPGNKTTHLASIAADLNYSGKIYACERDGRRSEILQTMTDRAGAERVIHVLKKQDFLALDPTDARFAGVTHMLLDPSCSGSGIVGREDIPVLELPIDPRVTKAPHTVVGHDRGGSKKRKRAPDEIAPSDAGADAGLEEEQAVIGADKERLSKLSNLQVRIMEHAMAFPAATRITYSTCSLHQEENEDVVARILDSEVARTRKWRVLRRQTQVDGMKKWKHRGVPGDEARRPVACRALNEEELDACIRCYPDDDEGTMGFFLCGFEREAVLEEEPNSLRRSSSSVNDKPEADELDEWGGFDD